MRLQSKKWLIFFSNRYFMSNAIIIVKIMTGSSPLHRSNLFIGGGRTKTLSTKFDLVVGASYDWRESKRAENYNSTTDVITDYDANDNQALNPMTGIVFRQNDWVTWHTNISKRTRFPTMKDRYSYRLGKSLPNPDLLEEKSLVYGSEVK